MKVLSTGLLVAALAGSIGVGPAFAAQSSTTVDTLLLAQASFDAELAAAVAACKGDTASAEACDAAVAAYIAAVKAAGLDPSDADDLLANLVVALAENSSTLPAAIRAILADAIETIAVAFVDPDRAAVAVTIAAAVEAGEEIETDPLYEPASPTG